MSKEETEEERAHRRELAEVYGLVDFEDKAMPVLSSARRELLVELISHPETLSNRELAYCRFFKSMEMESTDPAKAPYINGCYIYGTHTINNSSCGTYTGEIEFYKAVSAVIPVFPGFLKIRSRYWSFFFRNCAKNFLPLEEQQLGVHVFEQESNLISVMLKEMSRCNSHVYCYGVWEDPEIYNGEYKEALTGFYHDPSGTVLSRRMEFWGNYLIFMDTGNYYLQRLSVNNPQGARILEADFKNKRK